MSTYNNIRPKKREEARIWNYYNNTDKFDWIQIRFWPMNLASAVITESLNYQTRWQLMLYFIGNGMSVEEAVRTVKKMGENYFDKAAYDHVDSLARDIKAGKNNWEYWDELLGKRRNVRDSFIPERRSSSTRQVRRSTIGERNVWNITRRDSSHDNVRVYGNIDNYRRRREEEEKYYENDWFRVPKGWE